MARPLFSTSLTARPIVDSIEIKCPFPILRHNLEFIDSPGLGELNQTRMASTNRAKDGADLLCIIGETDRIKANELIMDSAIQAIAQHGPQKIAMIATKIDVLVDQDVLQELGPLYQEGREILSWIKVKRTMATTQKSDKRMIRQLSRYESYVIRQMKEAFVLDRARDLQTQIPDTLKELSDRNLADQISAIRVFSVSSAQYMRYAENGEFLFDQAPELSIEATGIPALRRHLLSLAADQNLRDYQAHVREFFPGLVAKIRRVVDPNRSEGFKVIAKAFISTIKYAAIEFDTVLTRCLNELGEQILQVLLEDRDHYLECLDQEAENWAGIKYFTFRKMVREHGILVPGASKVSKMRRGYNINRNIARLLTPAFRGLARYQKPKYQTLAEELHGVRKRVSKMVVTSIDSAESDLRSIEKAKKLWAPKGLALTTPIKNLVTKLEQMSDSVATLAARETDYLSFVAKQTSPIFAQVHVARPQKVLKTLKKRKSTSGEPVIVSVYEKPHGVFARELLLKLFKEGADTPERKEEDDAEDSQEEPTQDTDVVEKIMAALDGMIQKRYKLYANEFVDGIRATMQEFLDEIQELAPTEVEVTEGGQAARSRLAGIVEDLAKSCEQLQELVPVVG